MTNNIAGKENENGKKEPKQPNAAVNWDFSANVAPATLSQVQSWH